MIQLANDPNAQRLSQRPAANDGKVPADPSHRGRVGHAWPFLSRLPGHGAPQGEPKTGSDNGS
jgi:hypothetical protein